MSRYDKLFADLTARGEGAFVPFIMLGDPSPEDSLEIIRTVVNAGADALELGVPFSDPVADGPTIQKSHLRALDNGATVEGSLALIRQIRAEFPDLPIGMLIYGNVPFTRGLEPFYQEFKDAGADSILLPDVQVRQGTPYLCGFRVQRQFDTKPAHVVDNMSIDRKGEQAEGALKAKIEVFRNQVGFITLHSRYLSAK